MRAIFYPFNQETNSKTIVVKDDSAKHLQVVRVRENEEILVLNGSGLKAYTNVSVITKHQVELVVSKIEEAKAQHQISLAIANPKKDAFEDILKIAVELGVASIQPLSSDFSQYDFKPSERVERVLESALIQSNNPFLTKILPQISLSQFLENLKVPLYFFNSRPENCGKVEKISGEKIILIGPEGGFSPAEVAQITSKDHAYSIHLPTPILRAPTAVASSIGYLLFQEN